jgi:hypothetical protein
LLDESVRWLTESATIADVLDHGPAVAIGVET